MKNETLITTTVLILIGGCLYPKTNNDNQKRQPAQPIALVITHDVSKTFDHVTPPSSEQLRTWALQVATSGGSILFALIGNPDSTEPVRVKFLTPPSKPTDPTYSDEIEFNHTNDSIATINQRRIAVFVSQCLLLMEKTPPQQHTDLNGRLKEAAAFFNEPGSEKCMPLFFTNSDGWQDVKITGHIDTVLRPEILPTRVRCFTSKWKNSVLLPNVQPIVSLAAIEDVLTTFIDHK
jgi:hypothetical protein